MTSNNTHPDSDRHRVRIYVNRRKICDYRTGPLPTIGDILTKASAAGFDVYADSWKNRDRARSAPGLREYAGRAHWANKQGFAQITYLRTHLDR